MTHKSRIVAASTAAAVLAGAIAPYSAAQADSWGGGPRHAKSWQDRDWSVRDDRRYRGFENYRNPRRDYRDYRDYRAERREDRKDKKVAQGVAIGLGILMLGIIASEANRSHHDRY